jgi:hypothetical protein
MHPVVDVTVLHFTKENIQKKWLSRDRIWKERDITWNNAIQGRVKLM